MSMSPKTVLSLLFISSAFASSSNNKNYGYSRNHNIQVKSEQIANTTNFAINSSVTSSVSSTTSSSHSKWIVSEQFDLHPPSLPQRETDIFAYCALFEAIRKRNYDQTLLLLSVFPQLKLTRYFHEIKKNLYLNFYHLAFIVFPLEEFKTLVSFSSEEELIYPSGNGLNLYWQIFSQNSHVHVGKLNGHVGYIAEMRPPYPGHYHMTTRLLSTLLIVLVCSGNYINGAKLSGNKRRRVPTQIMTDFLNDAPAAKRAAGLLKASFTQVEPSPTSVEQIYADNPSPVSEETKATKVAVASSSSFAEVAEPEPRLFLPLRIIRLDEQTMQAIVELVKADNRFDLSLIFMMKDITFDTYVNYKNSMKTVESHVITLLSDDIFESESEEEAEAAVVEESESEEVEESESETDQVVEELAEEFITTPDNEFAFDFTNDNFLN